MTKRIAGITGVTLWAALIAAAVIVGLQATVNGEEIFDNLGQDWTVESSFTASAEQTQTISHRLGGRITKLTNTIISFEGQKLQVNVMHCPTSKDADIIYQAVLDGHDGVSAAAARDDNAVIEFAKSGDVNLMNKARRALGLPDTHLDALAGKLIRNVPDGWQIENSFIVSRDQTLAIAKKLGARIKKLSNTIFSVQGQRFQVNVIECSTPRAAEKIHKSILNMKSGPAFCLLLGDKWVVEFVGDDVELAKKAPHQLGLTPPVEDTTWQSPSLDINAKVAKLNIRTATLDDVIRTFGEPIEYIWGNKTFTKDNLPSAYSLDYPNGFSVLMSNGKVEELRHSQPGYKFRGKLQVGSTLEEVLDVLSKPKQIIEGKENKFKDRVLYKDIEGKKGTCYYANKIKGVRFFFADHKVTNLYVSRNDLSGRRRTQKTETPPAETAPQPMDIEAQAKNLVQLLVDGYFAKATENFDATMKKALPAENLREVWNSIVAQSGPFIKQLGTRKQKMLGHNIIFVTCKFERATLDTKVVFNRDKQIAGLFFLPAQSQ